MKRTSEIEKKLDELLEKYELIGQSTESYLEGLLYSNPLGYWDYIQTEALLSLQCPRIFKFFKNNFSFFKTIRVHDFLDS